MTHPRHVRRGAVNAPGSALVLSLLAIACVPPAGTSTSDPTEVRASSALWWKGNTHTHTLWSDGDDFPEMVGEWYRKRGYHFLSLTDHNTLASEERWITIPDRGPARVAYDQYVARHGRGVLQERRSGDTLQVRLRTLAEYRQALETREQFVLIPGEEITQYGSGRGAHMNALGLGEAIPPQTGATLIDVFRKDLAEVATQERRMRGDVVAVLNHPNFLWSQTAEDLLALRELRYFELYNGHPLVQNAGDSLHASTERMWDIVLAHRLARGEPPLYAVATDDAHDFHATGTTHRNAGRGWIMVRADSLTPKALLAAMKRGDFYASTGVMLREVRREGGRLVLDIAAEPGVTYSTRFVGTRVQFDTSSVAVHDTAGRPLTRRYGPSIGEVLAEIHGTAPSYQMRGDELYVRAVVTSSRPKSNPPSPGEMERAWTQPVRP